MSRSLARTRNTRGGVQTNGRNTFAVQEKQSKKTHPGRQCDSPTSLQQQPAKGARRTTIEVRAAWRGADGAVKKRTAMVKRRWVNQQRIPSKRGSANTPNPNLNTPDHSPNWSGRGPRHPGLPRVFPEKGGSIWNLRFSGSLAEPRPPVVCVNRNRFWAKVRLSLGLALLGLWNLSGLQWCRPRTGQALPFCHRHWAILWNTWSIRIIHF